MQDAAVLQRRIVQPANKKKKNIDEATFFYLKMAKFSLIVRLIVSAVQTNCKLFLRYISAQ